jgi:hypothetical protein
VTTDLNTLLTALYVKIDDHLGRRTRLGRPPKLSDAELLTLAVAQRAGERRRWPAGPAGCGRRECTGSAGSDGNQTETRSSLTASRICRTLVPAGARLLRWPSALETDLEPPPVVVVEFAAQPQLGLEAGVVRQVRGAPPQDWGRRGRHQTPPPGRAVRAVSRRYVGVDGEVRFYGQHALA